VKKFQGIRVRLRSAENGHAVLAVSLLGSSINNDCHIGDHSLLIGEHFDVVGNQSAGFPIIDGTFTAKVEKRIASR